MQATYLQGFFSLPFSECNWITHLNDLYFMMRIGFLFMSTVCCFCSRSQSWSLKLRCTIPGYGNKEEWVRACSSNKDPSSLPSVAQQDPRTPPPSLTQRLRAAILTTFPTEPLLRQSRPLSKPVAFSTTETPL